MGLMLVSSGICSFTHCVVVSVARGCDDCVPSCSPGAVSTWLCWEAFFGLVVRLSSPDSGLLECFGPSGSLDWAWGSGCLCLWYSVGFDFSVSQPSWAELGYQDRLSLSGCSVLSGCSDSGLKSASPGWWDGQLSEPV